MTLIRVLLAFLLAFSVPVTAALLGSVTFPLPFPKSLYRSESKGKRVYSPIGALGLLPFDSGTNAWARAPPDRAVLGFLLTFPSEVQAWVTTS